MVFLFVFPGISLLNGQVAEGGCDEVTVVGVPSYSETYGSFIAPYPCTPPKGSNTCCVNLANPYTVRCRFILLKKNTNGSFSQVGSPQYETFGQFTFENLSKGVYKVLITSPAADICPGYLNPVKAYNLHTGQYLGYYGYYDNGQDYYTNEVVVGNTTTSDKSLEFIDVNANSSDFLYDYNDEVAIDVSGSKNYDTYFLAIFEDGGPDRYKSTGWVNGTVSSYNLTSFWSSYDFEVGRTYKVQFVIENSECPNSSNPMWSVTDNFGICPEGTGCRTNFNQMIFTFPNPARDIVNLNGLVFYEKDIQYKVLSLTGQIVDAGQVDREQINLSGVPEGIYMLQISNDTEILHTQKLFIQK